MLNSSGQSVEPDAPTVETTPTIDTIPSPETTPTVDTIPSPDQASTAVNVDGVQMAENATPTTVDTAVTPNISHNERAKTFFKTNLHGIISAIVLFIITVALTITTICVTNPSLSANQIYEKVNPSVFYIEVDTAEGKQAGSGFFIDKKGTAVTNYHVIKGGSNAKITLPDGNKYDVERVLGCDSARDLVLLKVDINGSVPVQQGNSDKLKTGDKVYAIGYPESFIIGAEDSTFTDGIISKPAYNIDGVNYIQTTADITHGNSGGVLINSQGKVVGITTGKIDIGDVSYMNLALPVNNIGNIKSNINLPLQDFSSKYKDVTVTYMVGDEVYSRKTVTNGTKIPQSSGERHGYTFDGWFKDKELTTPFDFNTPVDGDTTIYGKWTEAPHYTVTYAFGNEVYTTIKVYEGDSVSDIAYYLSGYKFDGWYSDPQLTMPFDFNQKVNGDITVYGKRTPIKFTVVFDPNGGSGEMPVQSAICGDQITLNTNTFEKEGYYFTGWKYGEEEYIDGDTMLKYVDEGTVITLVAQWGKNLNGEGTQLSPYKVSNYDDLLTMADMVDKSVLHSKAYYVLTADIDCQSQPLKAIGGLTNPFSGTFDGQNHIISYAKFERTGDYIGLFGNVQLGTLKNFGIKNFQMTGGDTAKYCGAVVGKYISENVIENVFAKGTIDLSFKFGTNVVAGVYVGGFVGNMLGSAENCYFEGSISASTKYSGLNTTIRTGGFAGVIYGINLLIEDVNYSISATISNCYVNSSVTVDSSGGTSTKYITGGFAGALSKIDSEQIIIKHCVSIGDVKNINSSSNSAYGGFVGANNAGVDFTLVRRDSTSVCEGYGTAGPEVLKEDLSKLKNLQWLINEFGFSADIWADEYGLPMLKAYIKETV